jgi:hypothetical protein
VVEPGILEVVAGILAVAVVGNLEPGILEMEPGILVVGPGILVVEPGILPVELERILLQ